MENAVLDSYALLAFLYGERGQDKVQGLLERAVAGEAALSMAAPNWAEVRYVVERKSGIPRWTEIRDRLRVLPFEVVPADRERAEAAGALKAARKLSLADAFAAALAIEKSAGLVTGDPEFKAVERDVRVVWL